MFGEAGRIDETAFVATPAGISPGTPCSSPFFKVLSVKDDRGSRGFIASVGSPSRKSCATRGTETPATQVSSQVR
jgi:hypothetical protein